MDKKVLLIQPHSDDIILSASKYLYDPEYKKKVILTVENNPKRLLEDQEICNHFGAHLIRLLTPSDSTGFHKEYYADNKVMDDMSAMKFCENKMGADNLSKVSEELEELVTNYKNDGYEIVTCMGVGHPFHWLVRVITHNLADVFYRDFPHSYKRRNQAYLVGIVDTLFQLKELSDENHEGKIELFKKYYKTQSSFLFFEQRYIDKALPEEYYEKIKD